MTRWLRFKKHNEGKDNKRPEAIMVTSLENLVKERASTQMCNLAKMFDSTLFTPQSVSFLIDYNWFPVPGSLKTNKLELSRESSNLYVYRTISGRKQNALGQ